MLTYFCWEKSKVEEEKQTLCLFILHKRIGTFQIPKVTEVTSHKKTNVKPYEDDEDLSESTSEIEVNLENNKEVNQQRCCDALEHGEVTLQHDNLIHHEKVNEKTTSPDGSIIIL